MPNHLEQIAIGFGTAGVIVLAVFLLIVGGCKYRGMCRKNLFLAGKLWVVPEEFFDLRKKLCCKNGRLINNPKFNFEGIYIIHNRTRKKVYVGQSIRVGDRLNSHLTGKGNGHVFADYHRGRDRFQVSVVPLKDSGFTSLNAIEKHYIDMHNANDPKHGYNKTKGNK